MDILFIIENVGYGLQTSVYIQLGQITLKQFNDSSIAVTVRGLNHQYSEDDLNTFENL